MSAGIGTGAGRLCNMSNQEPSSSARPTVELDPRALTSSWPIVLAMMEQLAPWTVLALRLGTLALVQECVRAMTAPNAPGHLVVELESLVDALRYMPWDK